MDKASRMERLKTGRGIQYLLDEAYQILGNPLNTFDTDYRLIAYTDVAADDRFWNELITTGTFCMESQIFFMQECFTDDSADSLQAGQLAVMKSSKLTYDRIMGHIFNGNGIKVANVLMIETTNAFDPDMIAAFKILTDLLTAEIAPDARYIAYGEEYQNRWIKKLIDYDIEDKRLYSPHVQIIYNGCKENLYIAVADTGREDARPDELKQIADTCRRLRPDYSYAVYGSYIVLLMSTDAPEFRPEAEWGALGDYFTREHIRAGISSRFDNLFELRAYYAEAVRDLDVRC